MKSRATLSLVEMLIMLLVFFIAAAVCLSVFASADRISKDKELTSFAVNEVQNAAEAVRFAKGDTAKTAQLLEADNTGSEVTKRYENGVLTIEILSEDNSILGHADIIFEDSDGESVYELSVSWQEAA